MLISYGAESEKGLMEIRILQRQSPVAYFRLVPVIIQTAALISPACHEQMKNASASNIKGLIWRQMTLLPAFVGKLFVVEHNIYHCPWISMFNKMVYYYYYFITNVSFRFKTYLYTTFKNK